jgi:hypothetical protein
MIISENAANAQNEAQDADDRLLQQAVKESIENDDDDDDELSTIQRLC